MNKAQAIALLEQLAVEIRDLEMVLGEKRQLRDEARNVLGGQQERGIRIFDEDVIEEAPRGDLGHAIKKVKFRETIAAVTALGGRANAAGLAKAIGVDATAAASRLFRAKKAGVLVTVKRGWFAVAPKYLESASVAG